MQIQKIVPGPEVTVHDVKWDDSGKRLATASSDGMIKIIYLSKNNSSLGPTATLTTHQHQGPVCHVAWGKPEFGSILASCSSEGKVVIWKELSQNPGVWEQQFHVSNEHKSCVSCVSWAPHELGLCLAVGFSDGSISVLTNRSDGCWDTKVIETAHPGGVTSISWAPSRALEAHSGSQFASGGCDGAVKVWKLCNGTWEMDCSYPEIVQTHSDSERDNKADVSPREGRKNRWQVEEDELLIKAWLEIVGNEQRLSASWIRVAKYFEENRRGGVERSGLMLMKRWIKINSTVKNFVECYEEACREKQQYQGKDDGKDTIARAHSLYRSYNDGCRFTLVHAWILLKDEPRWKAHVNLLSCKDCSKRPEFGLDRSKSRNGGSSKGYQTRLINQPPKTITTNPNEVPLAMTQSSKACDNALEVVSSTLEGDQIQGERFRWYREDDDLLIRAWLTISKDPLEGNDKKMFRFWDRVTKYFEDNRGSENVRRSNPQLKDRWHRLSRMVKKFVECFDQACRQCQSETYEDRFAHAHRLYRLENDDCCFMLEHAWIVLKEEPIWRAYANLANCKCCSKRMKISSIHEASLDSSNNSSNHQYSPANARSSDSTEIPKNGHVQPSELPQIKSEVVEAVEEIGVVEVEDQQGASEVGLVQELLEIEPKQMKSLSALEELAKTKQMEIDMQIIYKDTSFMNKEQLQFHGHLVQRLKQKYLL